MNSNDFSELGPNKPGILERLGVALADWSERWFPDAYVFALGAVVIVCIGALVLGRAPQQIAIDFGSAYWNLIPFTMQMAFILIGGYIVATSPPVIRAVIYLAKFPKNPKSAVAYVAIISMLTSLLSWGLSIVFAGMLVREISKRVKDVDYRAMGAAAYLGLGSVWALGFSSSAALMMATKSSVPPTLYNISGYIPLNATIGTWQNLVLIVVLLIISVAICYFSTPTKKAKTAEMAGIFYQEELEKEQGAAKNPGEYFEHSPILTLIIAALGIGYIFSIFATKGFLAAVDLNTYNFIFIILGMLLHWTPKAFLRAAGKAIPMTGGILIQFPIYAGIYGILVTSGINELLVKFFVSISTQGTLPVIVGIYTAILGFFLPSGGGKWILEAPYVLEAANQLKVNLAWMVQVYNASEALPNLINPFFMLPLLSLTGVKARDLVGYSILQLIFHIPVVLFMLWLLAKTLPYVPPLMG